MELPADLKVNGKFFMHLSIREGGAHLHTGLLDFYTRAFGLDKVILRDEGNLLPKPVIADSLAGPKKVKLDEVLLVRADGVIEEFVTTVKDD